MIEQQPNLKRTVRSFVRREGRMTGAQKRALQDLWSSFGIGDDLSFDGKLIFGDQRPLTLEIGFGDGQVLIGMARQNPGVGFLGIDPHRPGVGRLLHELAREDILNVRVMIGDAGEIVPRAISEHTLERILVFFPDPWPKKRHHKRRLLNDVFLGVLANRLKQNGTLHVATDWIEYAQEILDAVDRAPLLQNAAGQGNFSPRPDWRPLTKYERRGLNLGHRVFDILAHRT